MHAAACVSCYLVFALTYTFIWVQSALAALSRLLSIGYATVHAQANELVFLVATIKGLWEQS